MKADVLAQESEVRGGVQTTESELAVSKDCLLPDNWPNKLLIHTPKPTSKSYIQLLGRVAFQ